MSVSAQAAMLPSPQPPFVCFIHLTQTNRLCFPPTWSLTLPPTLLNGSNRLYGCLHGNHSVNSDQCCMLLAFTTAEKHTDELKVEEQMR